MSGHEADFRFMRLALDQARAGERRPGGAEVGCVIVRNGEVIAAGHNEAEGQFDPTAHAEIVTLRRAGRALGSIDLSGSALYCTLQPCGMCTVACVWAKIARIVYGATRAQVHACYFDQRHWNTVDLIRDSYQDDIEVTGGFLAGECAALYYGPDEIPDNVPPPARPRVGGVVETSLYVADLERTEDFFRRVFEFETIFEEGNRIKAMGVAGRQVLLLFRIGGSVRPAEAPGGTIPPHDGGGNLHLAFSIAREEVGLWEERLARLNVPIESRVACAEGATSLYFRDPDGHLLELITPGCWEVY
jgi:tRNA(adenine34) deaminase